MKYVIAERKSLQQTLLIKTQKIEVPRIDTIAIFVGTEHKTNAQKVCDLLNEASRSQGKNSGPCCNEYPTCGCNLG